MRKNYILSAFSVLILSVLFVPAIILRDMEQKPDVLVLEMQKRVDFQDCIDSAYRSYSTNWNNVCGEDACMLPEAQTKRLDQILKDDKDRCAMVYK